MTVIHRDDVDPATAKQWDELCRDTTRAMMAHCMRYVTPISVAVEHDWGVLEGTGGYIGFEGKRLLITNEHVLRDWKTRQFCHQFHGCNDVFKLDAPLALEPHPVDSAVCTIKDTTWNLRTHNAEVVPPTRIAARHSPVPGELLFFIGYPQQRSKSLYKNLFNEALHLATQEPPNSPIPNLHPNYFLLAYSPARAQSVDPANQVTLSNPNGLSGSLIWNTRRVECLQLNREWSPDFAEVTGMLCRWDSPTSTLMAVRIEIVADFLRRRVK
jgi:hypothetical protein